MENVEIIVRDTSMTTISFCGTYLTTQPSTEWAEEKGMNTFLSVTHGSDEPAKLLEM